MSSHVDYSIAQVNKMKGCSIHSSNKNKRFFFSFLSFT
jgi:hypothetical protein